MTVCQGNICLHLGEGRVIGSIGSVSKRYGHKKGTASKKFLILVQSFLISKSKITVQFLKRIGTAITPSPLLFVTNLHTFSQQLLIPYELLPNKRT